eukprot:1183324-Rhodomonas_salina.4
MTQSENINSNKRNPSCTDVQKAVFNLSSGHPSSLCCIIHATVRTILLPSEVVRCSGAGVGGLCCGPFVQGG